MTIDEVLRSVELKPGITFVDGQGILMATPTPEGQHRMSWKAYLVHMTDPTGPEGEGARMRVHRIDIPFGPWERLEPHAVERLRESVERHVAEFQEKLEAGTAPEIQDGDLLP